MAAVLNLPSRNLTDLFVLMRNNSLRSKTLSLDQMVDDKVALISYGDIEKGHAPINATELPLRWIEGIEDVQYEMSRIGQKLQELQLLYEKHLMRPSIDDAVQEERDIEILTEDVVKMFHHCQMAIRQIQEKSHGMVDLSLSLEKAVNKNVVNFLVSSLQELSSSFYSAQTSHLEKLRCREEKSKSFFASPYFSFTNDCSVYEYSPTKLNQSFIQAAAELQQTVLENNAQMVEQREREIRQVVHSLAELNCIFKDIAIVVTDQEALLDRIDYNLEQVQAHIHDGLQELQKAEEIHRKNNKILYIIFLAAVLMMLITILVIIKT